MTRRHLPLRFATTLWIVVSLLFSQLALANYVCPSSARMMASGEPCEGMDSAQPVLCHQHGAAASQTFEVVKVVSPSLPAIVQVLVVPLVLDPADAVAVSITATVPVRPPPDPLFLSTLRLRV
jgi:hypothetical protein